MCDKNRSATQGDAHGDRIKEVMPECCGPILERVKEVLCDIAQDSPSGPEFENGGAKNAACTPAMRRMAAICCGSLTTEERQGK